MIYQSKQFSPLNAIKYILKHLQHTFQLLIYHIQRSTHQTPHISTLNYRYFRKLSELSRTQFNLTLCDLYIKHFTPLNAIKYYKSSSTHISAHHQTYTHALSVKILIDLNKSQTFQKTIRVIAYQQFNLTLCDLLIKTLLAYQRKQIYSEASSTHFSAINLWYTYALPIIILIDPNKSQTFQKTISVIAEHNSIWHFAIYQSKDFSPLNAIKYILKHLQLTFQLLIYHIQRSTHHNPHWS